jgi:hypothetical protein
MKASANVDGEKTNIPELRLNRLILPHIRAILDTHYRLPKRRCKKVYRWAVELGRQKTRFLCRCSLLRSRVDGHETSTLPGYSVKERTLSAITSPNWELISYTIFALFTFKPKFTRNRIKAYPFPGVFAFDKHEFLHVF